MEDIGELLGIEVDLSDEDAPNGKSRTEQSEADFQRQKASWKPIIDQGDIWKTLTLPPTNPSKVESQRILHAIEELYYHREFKQALGVADQALKGTISQGFRETLMTYRQRCADKEKLEQAKGK